MEKITVEIPNYIIDVKLSNARLRKYYEKGKTLPKAQKYLDESKYEWKVIKKREYLVDKETDERVIANPKAAGTPRILRISGQKIYNGEINKQLRNKVLMSIKAQFANYINKLEVIEAEHYPLKITLEIHDTIHATGSKSLWDADNRSWPYIKAFQDCLTGNKDKEGNRKNKQIIPDDNILFITTPPATKYIPIEEGETRKLIFTIESEDDERVLNSKVHKTHLNDAINKFERVSFWGEQDLEG